MSVAFAIDTMEFEDGGWRGVARLHCHVCQERGVCVSVGVGESFRLGLGIV